MWRQPVEAQLLFKVSIHAADLYGKERRCDKPFLCHASRIGMSKASMVIPLVL